MQFYSSTTQHSFADVFPCRLNILCYALHSLLTLWYSIRLQLASCRIKPVTFPRCEVTNHCSKRIYDIVVVAVHCSLPPHTIAVFHNLGFFRQKTTFTVVTRVKNNLPLVYKFVCIMSLHYYKCCLSQLTFLLHKPDYGWMQTYKVYQCAECVAMI